jgi:hypothetical protein
MTLEVNYVYTILYSRPEPCSIIFLFFETLFYSKKQWKKVNKDCKKLETMKKIKNSEENK